MRLTFSFLLLGLLALATLASDASPASDGTALAERGHRVQGKPVAAAAPDFRAKVAPAAGQDGDKEDVLTNREFLAIVMEDRILAAQFRKFCKGQGSE